MSAETAAWWLAALSIIGGLFGFLLLVLTVAQVVVDLGRFLRRRVAR